MRYADSHCTYTEVFENGEQFYLFTGKCIFTGKSVTVKVPAPGLYAYRQGAHIQDAFPEMSAGDREFLMSGISDEGWDQTFKEEEEECEP